jgi:RNA polymerase sigma-70 factor (ECF subfamily)
MNPTPASLLHQLQQATDATAWSRFVALYTPLLYRWAGQAGLQDTDAADLVQEVFLVLVRKLPEFDYDRDRSFRSSLKTVTLNKYRDLRRQRHAEPDGDLDRLPGPEVDAFAEEEHRRYLVGRALELMQRDFQPPTWQLVALGRPVAEVAAELGISIKAAYLAKARVLRRLHPELAGLID